MMKKQLTFLLTLSIALFASGCGNQPANVPTHNGVKATSSLCTDSLSSVAQKTAQKAGWPTKEWCESTPEEQGMDPVKLDKADQRVRDNYPNIYSLLVVRHGFLVYEKYYQGMNRDDANPVYSVTKSVMSALTGIALHKKQLQSVDQKVSDILPEYFAKTDDPQKKAITLENVLTMTGGLESVDKYFGSYYVADNWMDYALKLPMTDKPGTKFVYNTGLTHFLSLVISKVSGTNTKDYAQKYLFSKIGVKEPYWMQDANGYYGGGMGLSLTPRNMAKFGYLYLHQGNWDGEQVIPQDWVAQSTRKHMQAADNLDYGYLFWVQKMSDPVSGKVYSTFRADGAGGQKIIEIPELDMVAVVAANVTGSSKDREDTQTLISDYVFPAVNDIR